MRELTQHLLASPQPVTHVFSDMPVAAVRSMLGIPGSAHIVLRDMETQHASVHALQQWADAAAVFVAHEHWLGLQELLEANQIENETKPHFVVQAYTTSEHMQSLEALLRTRDLPTDPYLFLRGSHPQLLHTLHILTGKVLPQAAVASPGYYLYYDPGTRKQLSSHA